MDEIEAGMYRIVDEAMMKDILEIVLNVKRKQYQVIKFFHKMYDSYHNALWKGYIINISLV